jgi:hypothetical protein
MAAAAREIATAAREMAATAPRVVIPVISLDYSNKSSSHTGSRCMQASTPFFYCFQTAFFGKENYEKTDKKIKKI